MTDTRLPADIAAEDGETESILDFANRDPFPFYERLRARGSPIWDDSANAWLVLDFDQCAAAERDERIFANAYIFADEQLKKIKGGGANITLSKEGEHIKLRRFHLKLLSPGRVEQFRETHIQQVIDRVLRKFEDRRTVDLFEDFAAQIPPRVICSLLGMPHANDATMARILVLNDEIVHYIASGYSDSDLADRALTASRELNEMLLPHIRERRENPGNDFISRVWMEAADAGIALDEEGALGLCRELYFAGSDTTVHGIANALYLLLNDEDLLRQVRSDRQKPLSALIEESLRLFNVVQFRHRICLQETRIGDTTIREGQTIILVHAGANRDGRKYGCPADVSLDRRGPTDHLAFGKGTRSCVGAQLARVEMREAISMLLDRFGSIELDRCAESPYFRAFYMRSMGPLHTRIAQ